MRRIFAALAIGGALGLAMPIVVPAHAEDGKAVIRIADRDHDRDHRRNWHNRQHKVLIIKRHRHDD